MFVARTRDLQGLAEVSLGHVVFILTNDLRSLLLYSWCKM